MKIRKQAINYPAAVLAVFILAAAPGVKAASGTWTQLTSGGLWSAGGNWSSTTVADGSGFTADFSTLNITAANTVKMDAAHTLTALTFADTTTPFVAWTLDNNGVAGNILTLAGTTPSITVGASSTATISAVIDGTTAWSKLGTGTLILSGANTFNAAVTIGGGASSVLSFNSLANGGTACALGKGTSIIVGASNSGLTYSGAGESTDRTLTIGNLKLLFNNSGAGTLTLAGSVTTSGTTGNLQIRSGLFNVSGVISGAGQASVNTGGTLTLGNSGNSFSGVLDIVSGTISVNSIAAGGSPSAAGAGTTINIGSGTTSGKLVYTGGASTTDRTINLTGNTGAPTIDQSGISGLLKFTANLTAPGAAATDVRKTLTLQGSLGGTGEIAGIIPDSAAGNSGQTATSLKKDGTGTWTLSGANTYSGITTVSGGTLLANTTVSGSATGSGAVSVSSTATLGSSVAGRIAGAVTYSAGSHAVFTVTPSGGANTTPLTLGSTLAIATSGTIPDVHLNLPTGLAPGTYTLATYTSSGSSGAFNTTPIIDSGSIVSGGTKTVTTSGGNIILTIVGPVDHFAISSIASPQVAGTTFSITTITAQDTANQTVTSFGSTVTFGGTAGVTGTSGTFTSGVLSGASVQPTVAGSSKTVTVSDGSGHTGSVSITTINPGSMSASQSTVIASPTGVPNDNSTLSTITITAKDAYGNPISGIAAGDVVVASTGSGYTLTQPGSATDASGQTTATIKSGTIQNVTVSATISGTAVTQTAAVAFTGAPVDVANSSVTATPNTGLVADGSEASTITITAKDASNNPIPNGLVSVLVSGTGNTLTPATPADTDANGQSVVTLKSTKAETKTITVSVNGTQITNALTVQFVPGAMSGSVSTLTASPASLVADGSATTTVTVTALDAYANGLAGLTVTPTVGGTANTVSSLAATDANGQTTFTVASTKAETKSISAAVGTTNITQTASVTFVPGVVAVVNSTAVASPTSVAADGTTAATVTVSLADANNNTLGAGTNVSWSVTGTGNTVSPASSGTTDASGGRTFTVKSIKAETKTVTVNVGATVITNSLAITFTVPGSGNVFNWDPSHTPATASDGAGTWDTSTANWTNNGVDVAWPNNGNDSAVFGTGGAPGSDYAVTLATPVSVGNLTFANSANQYQLTGQSVTLSNTPAINVAANGLISSPLTGSGFVKTGTGTLRIDGNATNFTDNITVSNGWLQIGNNGSSGSLGTGTITMMDGATFSVRRTGTLNFSNTLAGTFTSAIQFQLNGAVVTLFKANTYTTAGGTSLQPTGSGTSGTLKLGINNALPTSTAFSINQSGASRQTFDLAGYDQTMASLGGSGTATTAVITNSVSATTSTLTLAGSSKTTTYAGLLTGNLNLTLTGSGSALTLSGANTYTGNTTISAGTLALSGSGSIANSPHISLSGGAVFDVSGKTGVNGFVLGSGQTLSNKTAATVTLAGNLTNDSGTISVSFTAGTPAFAVTNGTLALGAGSVFNINNVGSTLGSGNYRIISKITAGNAGTVGGTAPASVTVSGGGVNGTASLQIISGELYLKVVETTTLALISSAPTNGYLSGITFTATVNTNGVTAVAAGGNVIFFYTNLLTGITLVPFSTNPIVSGGTVVSDVVSSLPRGTSLITASYSGDANYLPSTVSLYQIVTNHPPVANAGSYSRGAANNWHIFVSELLTNATDSIDGDPLTLVSVSGSTNGITLYQDGTIVGYLNTNLVTDQFTYTVTDGFGGTNSGTITLTATTTVTGNSSIASITGTNPKVLTAYGILNATYVTQRATNLDQEVWEDIATNHLGASGPFTVTDTNPPPGSAYYRLLYPVPQP